ncbi:MAG TPA: N-6 DNA methylase [Clostridium sp.]|uniref:N-6 DNA methylase n=1 Tax=Clostridium sp. TaxID=1506 RepID=UPI002F941958
MLKESGVQFKAKFIGFVDSYIKGVIGQNAFRKYLVTCNVTPKNIYTDNIDYCERYREESYIIHQLLEYMVSIGFNIKDILNSINEIVEFYPWVHDIRFITNGLADDEKGFPYLLHEYLEGFFKINNPRQYGEYYTPKEMVSLALEQIDLNINDKVIDPSCGSGFFLFSYIEEINKLGLIKSEDDINKLQERVFGYDIFPFAIITTKLLLGYQIFSIFKKKDKVFNYNNIRIVNTIDTLKCKSNTMTKKHETDFDFVLGNPPFFRIDPKNKNSICDCVSFGHNYAHSIFLHWAIQNLKDNGKLCLFLPQSMLSGYYYQKSRKELLSKMRLHLIIRNKNHEKDFDVQQDIIILIAHKSNKEYKSFRIATSLNDYSGIQTYSLPLKITDNKLNIIPVIKNNIEFEVLRKISKLPLLRYIYKLKMSTGNYVWNQNKDLCITEKTETSIPLISGPNITIEGIILEIDRANNIPYCLPDKKKYIKTHYAILFRRMSPIGNEKRMIAAIIDPNEIKEYVVENHVNIIECENKSYLNDILRLISSSDFNILIDAFCHTNQVSTNELKIIFEILQKMSKMKNDNMK